MHTYTHTYIHKHAYIPTHIHTQAVVQTDGVRTYRWSCLLKALEQSEHVYFRSSLWMSLCLARALELLKVFRQVGHWIIVLQVDATPDDAFDGRPFVLERPDDLTLVWTPVASKELDSLSGEPLFISTGEGTWKTSFLLSLFLLSLIIIVVIT